jgi:putative intracellular protease/amidase
MEKAVHVLVFDGYADWEPALAMAWIRTLSPIPVVSVGLARTPVTSMGGLHVVPELSLDEVDPQTCRLFIVPGGDGWSKQLVAEAPVVAKLHALRAAAVPVAAICDATLVFARAGLLNQVAHTGNAAFFLAEAGGDYAGGDRYVDEPAVRDGGVITASGLGNVEVAREILAELAILTPEKRRLRAQVFRAGRITPDVDLVAAFG